jgi:uncharacterized membrane protein
MHATTAITINRPVEEVSQRWQEFDLEGAPAGSVRFVAAPADQGTEVIVEVEESAPGGAIGSAVAIVLGKEPIQQIRDHLRRFKQVVETGEVVVSDAVPHGTSTQRRLDQEEARP